MAVGLSAATHIVLVLLSTWIAARPHSLIPTERPRESRHGLVWIPSTNPIGGGGGGGDRTALAASARRPGPDRLTLVTPTSITPVANPTPPPLVNAVTILAKPMSAGTDTAPGMITSSLTAETTQGPGTDGGGGSGSGGGSGDGHGLGLGRGFGDGTGERGYGPGSGVTLPQLVRQVKPLYTADAMRAKVQGVALLECVVLPDGTVGDVRVLKSVDRVFGLDDEAVKAARQWRFIPGKRLGEPVPVLISIELSFALR
jgi:protein TonB